MEKGRKRRNGNEGKGNERGRRGKRNVRKEEYAREKAEKEG